MFEGFSFSFCGSRRPEGVDLFRYALGTIILTSNARIRHVERGRVVRAGGVGGGGGGGVIRAYRRSTGGVEAIVEVRLTVMANIGNNDIAALTEGGRIHLHPNEETLIKLRVDSGVGWAK